MSTASLLIEIGTEELPPKALNALAQHFADQVEKGLTTQQVDHGAVTVYASPRRMAVKIDAVADKQPDQSIERRGPAMGAAYDAAGTPTKALQGFVKSCGAELDQLTTIKTDKGEWVAYQCEQPGQPTQALLAEIVMQALKQLPIPKMMRWGDRDDEFVRPVHWVLALLGDQVVPMTLFGVESGKRSYGHRFHAPDAITIDHADDYEQRLAENFVLAKSAVRQEKIQQQIKACAATIKAEAIVPDALLQEVANIVEWPVALLCQFERDFLAVPQEALISSMQSHQKCFALQDQNGQLLPHFITISNIDSSNPDSVVKGNEKVMHARLSDAAFFYNSDGKKRLEEHLPALAKTTFQKQLGSLADKAERIAGLSAYIAEQIGADVSVAKHAALLCKADLMTDMVGEFPDLQGVMGCYYACNDGESEDVAVAIRQHYQPRFASDAIAAGTLGKVIALADKLDTLVGIFGIGQPPSGSKDPFALRRAALGVLRTCIEGDLDIDLLPILQHAVAQYQQALTQEDAAQQVLAFCLERLKAYYLDQGIPHDSFDAVHSLLLSNPLDFKHRLQAVQTFRDMPVAESLAAANKRVQNLLSKNAGQDHVEVDEALLQEVAEQQLFAQAKQLHQAVAKHIAQSDYTKALCELAKLELPINAFFDGVMVMAEDPAVKQNRLALLQFIHGLFIQIADLSKLQ